VEKITNEKGLTEYLIDAPDKLLMQEFIALPEEYGVMYYRFSFPKIRSDLFCDEA
jgi:hypothetical protein